MRAHLTVLLAVAAAPAVAPAAVVCIQNRTAADIAFAVAHAPDKRRDFTLAAGDTVAIPVGREPTLIVTRSNKNERFKLDPYTPYLFVPRGDSFDFQGAKLAGELPKPDDVPAQPDARKLIRVPVSLLVDDRDGRVRAAWEKVLRERFAAAAGVFEAHVGVTFAVEVTAEWKTTAEVGWDFALEHFKTTVETKPGGLAVGYLARSPTKDEGEQFSATGRPWKAHVLLRDNWPKTEAERVDALTHALGRHLGAVKTADPASVMREKFADGGATKPGYRPRFDPLNLLVMHVWAEEKAGGHGLTWETLRPKARARLLVLYKTLAELPSKDPLATEYVEALADGKEARPAPAADPPRKLSDRDAAVHAVVKAVGDAAKTLAADPKRPKNDALTVEYIRAAAAAAEGQHENHRAAAFLIGLGLALDDSTILRSNPLTKRMCERVETDAERKDRLAVLGVPTVRGRRDLCQHFVVSVALVQLVGAEAAEFAGLSKELSDLKGASGFSFVDLSADYAGVAFAKEVAADPPRLAKLKDNFAVADWVPAFDGLREGLPEEKFKADFGSPEDKRFKAVVEDIRKRVAALPAHKK